MGKRKERRLAAMSAAGRRVKLDLFAEPSGEMVDKSSKDETRGDPDQQDHHAGVPLSPSTSGQNQENPLLLLGQYSDDEVNDDGNRDAMIEVEGNLSIGAAQEGEHVDVDGNAGSTIEQEIDAGKSKEGVDKLDATTIDGNNVRESGVFSEAGLKGADLVEEASAPPASAMQIIGDVTDGWKIVMHEQSNQYYYWNTLTGETSWEVPDVLSHIVETSSDQKASLVTEERVDALTAVHASIPQVDAGSVGYVNVVAVDNGNDHLLANAADTINGFIVGKENDANGNMGYDDSQAAVHYSSARIGSISYPEVLAHHSFSTLARTNALSEHLANSKEASGLMATSEVKDKHLLMADGSFEATEVHPAELVKYGESLLQRLKMLKGSDESLQGYDWSLKCILEVETRLSDCKALSTYGSSLLPFWWHTETQLKRIETIIDQKGSLVLDNKSYNEESGLNSSLKSANSLDGEGQKLGMKDNILSNAENTYCSDTSVSKETSHEPRTEDAVSAKRLHSGSLEVEAIEEFAKSPASVPQPEGGSQESQAKEEGSVNPVSVLQLSGSDLEGQATYKADTSSVSPKIESRVDEDIDMDVEMEVDEEEPVDQPAFVTTLHPEYAEKPEQLIEVRCVAAQDIPSDSSHEINVPPPPDEEWIPPPPPEDEAIPPPPPEEPPMQSIPPPPYAENVPSFSYAEQYNVAYPIAAFEYYAPSMDESSSAMYYAPAVSNVESQPPSYYDPVAATSFAEANLDANAVEPVVYYDVPIEAMPPIPVASSLEASGFYVQSGSASYNNDSLSTSENSGSVMIGTECTSSLPTHKVESSLPLVSRKPDKVIEPGASLSITSQSTGAVSVNGTSSDVISATNAKNQTKVARSKKRTLAVASTLRSNKKVSSLVDKWKAAKEELHGDEDDEPENAYEFLEKKRKKEIEEWKARQIVSGEAQDNANFLPLGGDWRERVKRRRAEANAQSTQTPPEEVKNEKKQPDLVELSKGLPSGWQAYWDESSQEVYYGNATTAETTWIRPSR